MSHRQFDVVVAPFPFTERPVTKKRFAMVISDAGNFNDRIKDSVLAMITSPKNSRPLLARCPVARTALLSHLLRG